MSKKLNVCDGQSSICFRVGHHLLWNKQKHTELNKQGIKKPKTSIILLGTK